MKIINPKVEILPQTYDFEGLQKIIEIAGRTCYKSHDKITEDSSEKFVQMLIDNDHTAMLEHGSIYLYFPAKYSESTKYYDNAFSRHYVDEEDNAYITTNLRVLIQNNWLSDLQYLCEPMEYHDKRVTVRFTTQIAISREFNRHRLNSIAEESTRYCNYGKKDEISINLPSFINPSNLQYIHNILENSRASLKYYCKVIASDTEESNMIAIDYWLFANLACEYSYLNMLKLGNTPQEARTILPLDLNTELIHTAFIDDWSHFFDLRTAPNAHPDARALAVSLQKKFKKLNFI